MPAHKWKWNRRTKTAGFVALLLCCTLCVLALIVVTKPTTSDRLYALEDREEEPFEFPLKIGGDRKGLLRAQFTMELGLWHPTAFLIIPDDCLETLEINGQAVDDRSLPFCDYTNGRTFDLSDHLHAGENTIVATIRNHGGDALLHFERSWGDLTLLVPFFLLPLLLLALILFLYGTLRPPQWVALLGLILTAATLLRVFYVLATPYWVRGHDTDGHIEYIEYIAENWQLPKPNEGWEYWHPPLYYVKGAAWMSAGEALGLNRMERLFSLQIMALLLSLLTLGICVWIGWMLFEKKERPIALPWFTAAIAFIPSLIFNAARINNDVLAITLAFAAIGCLIAWWKKQTWKMWIAVAVLIGLHLLTKNTGLLLLPVVFGSLLLARGVTWKRKAILGGISLGIIVLLSGWFTVYRHLQNTNQDMIVGNTGTLNSGLSIPNSVAAFTVFNPLKVIAIPYNNPWDDAARRQYFWEYWYRSAFFGEFHFGEDRKLMASWILVWSMLSFLVVIAGFLWAMRRKFHDSLPMLLTLVVFALGHAAFRMEYAFGSSQDFRYALLVLLPLAYYLTVGLLSLRNPLLQRAAGFTVQTFIVLCAMFLMHL